jgi:hypothetical protein
MRLRPVWQLRLLDRSTPHLAEPVACPRLAVTILRLSRPVRFRKNDIERFLADQTVT